MSRVPRFSGRKPKGLLHEAVPEQPPLPVGGTRCRDPRPSQRFMRVLPLFPAGLPGLLLFEPDGVPAVTVVGKKTERCFDKAKSRQARSKIPDRNGSSLLGVPYRRNEIGKRPGITSNPKGRAAIGAVKCLASLFEIHGGRTSGATGFDIKRFVHERAWLSGSCSPHWAQNLVEKGMGALHFGQCNSSVKFNPQAEQNFARAGRFLAHRGHFPMTTIWCPQWGQKRADSGIAL